MNEKFLVWVLRVSGVVLLTALIPVVMPYIWMQEIHRWMGMGELPAGPILGYLTRSLSLFYAMHGALLLFVSRDVSRFLPVIKCLAILAIAFGAIMVFLDTAVGMPAYWIMGEGPIVIVLGVAILWLAHRTRHPTELHSGTNRENQ